MALAVSSYFNSDELDDLIANNNPRALKGWMKRFSCYTLNVNLNSWFCQNPSAMSFAPNSGWRWKKWNGILHWRVMICPGNNNVSALKSRTRSNKLDEINLWSSGDSLWLLLQMEDRLCWQSTVKSKLYFDVNYYCCWHTHTDITCELQRNNLKNRMSSRSLYSQRWRCVIALLQFVWSPLFC